MITEANLLTFLFGTAPNIFIWLICAAILFKEGWKKSFYCIVGMVAVEILLFYAVFY